MSDSKAWSDRKPLTGNLPEVYQENEVAQWLSTPWDKFCYSLKAAVDEVYSRQLNPTLCDREWLDFLAALSGFIGEYWDKTWEDAVKRSLISKGLPYLWRLRGTRQVLEAVLKIFLSDRFDIWTEEEFRCDVTVLDDFNELGNPEYRYFIRVPIAFSRGGKEFRLAQQLNRLYGAFYCDSDVVYDGFYCDFSAVGDPVFDETDAIP